MAAQCCNSQIGGKLGVRPFYGEIKRKVQIRDHKSYNTRKYNLRTTFFADTVGLASVS